MTNANNARFFPIRCLHCDQGIGTTLSHECKPADVEAVRAKAEARAAARARDAGTILDWNTGAGIDLAANPLSYRAWDAATGEEISHWFHINKKTNRLGRYRVNTRGNLLLGPDGPMEIWESCRPVHIGTEPPTIRFREFL